MTERPTLSPAEALVLGHVSELDAVQTLCQLTDIPSVGGTTFEDVIQQDLAARLMDLGLDVDLWALDLDTLRTDAGFPGEEVHRESAYGLAARLGPSDSPPSLILQGHVDVVPPGRRSLWTYDPFHAQLRDGTVYGRGTCDMKGGIASILTAIAAIRRSDVVLRRPVTVQFVVGEEDGGLGAFATLRRHPTGDFCIIPEPTNLQVIGDAAGALSFRITVPGSSAHASMRHLGVSSVEKYILVHRALQDLEARRNAVVEHGSMRHLAIPYAISIGKLQSGDWASTVPDVLVAEGRIGVRLGEPPEVARAELETAVASVCAGDGWLSTHPASVEWIGGQFASSHLPAASPLIGLVSSAHWDANGADHPRSIGVPYGSDMRLYHAAGIPTVHYGPGDPQLAHSADECIPVYQVTRAARTLAVLILRTSHEIRM